MGFLAGLVFFIAIFTNTPSIAADVRAWFIVPVVTSTHLNGKITIRPDTKGLRVACVGKIIAQGKYLIHVRSSLENINKLGTYADITRITETIALSYFKKNGVFFEKPINIGL